MSSCMRQWPFLTPLQWVVLSIDSAKVREKAICHLRVVFALLTMIFTFCRHERNRRKTYDGSSKLSVYDHDCWQYDCCRIVRDSSVYSLLDSNHYILWISTKLFHGKKYERLVGAADFLDASNTKRLVSNTDDLPRTKTSRLCQ